MVKRRAFVLGGAVAALTASSYGRAATNASTITLDTMQEMRKSATKAENILLRGYYVAGDIAPARYVRRATKGTPSDDNQGTQIVGTDGTYWAMEDTSTVTFRNFGARGNGSDDTVAIQKAVSANKVVKTDTNARYGISRSIDLKSGSKIDNVGNAQFVYMASAPDGGPETPMFQAITANDITFIKPIFVNENKNDSVFGFRGKNISNLTMQAPQSRECSIAKLGSLDVPWEKVNVDSASPSFNGNRNIRITDINASGRGPGKGVAAIVLMYCVDWSVIGGTSTNIQYPVQFWGGDSDVNRNGAQKNERKCKNGLVQGITATNNFAGPWGSMGEKISLLKNKVINPGDVGIDFEGCVDCLAADNEVTDAGSANYAVFWLNTGIIFERNKSLRTKPGSHFRVFNATQNLGNTGLVIRNNTFETQKAIGTLDSGSGPVDDVEVTKNTFKNTRIDLKTNNMHQIICSGNTLTFDLRLTQPKFEGDPAGSAFAVGNVVRSGRVELQDNVVTSSVAQPVDVSAFEGEHHDFNSSSTFSFRSNRSQGFPVDLRMRNVSANPGVAARVNLAGNQMGAGVIKYERRGKSRIDLVD